MPPTGLRRWTHGDTRELDRATRKSKILTVSNRALLDAPCFDMLQHPRNDLLHTSPCNSTTMNSHLLGSLSMCWHYLVRSWVKSTCFLQYLRQLFDILSITFDIPLPRHDITKFLLNSCSVRSVLSSPFFFPQTSHHFLLSFGPRITMQSLPNRMINSQHDNHPITPTPSPNIIVFIVTMHQYLQNITTKSWSTASTMRSISPRTISYVCNMFLLN